MHVIKTELHACTETHWDILHYLSSTAKISSVLPCLLFI